MPSNRLCPYKLITIIIDYISYAAYYLSVAYLFYNWISALLNPLHLCCPSPQALPFWQPPIFSLLLWVCLGFFFL